MNTNVNSLAGWDKVPDLPPWKALTIYYHFTGDTLRNGQPIPPIGKWLTFDGEPEPCECGLHASPTAFDALQYAPGTLLHKVHLGGEIKAHGDPVDKFAAQKRKIIASIDATATCRAFARRVALDVIHLWDAPDVVKQYLETGDESLRYAAFSAAYAASSAASAAASAAHAAASYSAASAAFSASYSAASAAHDAAYYAANSAASAYAAASDAAHAAAYAAAATAYESATSKHAGWFKEMVEAEFAAKEAAGLDGNKTK
jgi:hypothetical protein